MNRSLGFGVVAVSALPVLTMGMPSASAHPPPSLGSAYGTVYVFARTGGGHHYQVQAVDVPGDNVWTRGEWILASGAKGGVTAPLGSSALSREFASSNEVEQFRKCHRIGSDPWACGDYFPT